MSWSWIRPGNELKALAQETPYAQMVETMRSNVAYWQTHFEDSPDRKPGWAHNYVCPHCAGQLVFDREKPREHRCPACNIAVENTRDILEAWTYYARAEIGNTLVEAAILYTMDGEQSYYDFIVRVINYYADHYAEFDEYGTHAGRGKVLGQSLDEAVWGDNLLKALITIQFDGQGELGLRWFKQLFLPASRLVMAQSSLIHNIPLWHASFALGTGLFFGDDKLAEQAWTGDLGARNQILKGFTPDGIWYENSTGYHYYSLQAASMLCLFARYKGMEDAEVFGRVINGYVAFLKLRFQNDTMPAFNDGWRGAGELGLRGRLDMYMYAARLFEGIDGAEQLAAAISDMDTYGTLGEFLYGKVPTTQTLDSYGSVNLPSNCLGMLRSEQLEVFVKYGNLHRSHAHADALQIVIPPFTCDLGTPGYGSPFHNGWYTQTLSHATFVVDGKSQKKDARGTGTLSPDGKIFDMEIDDAYEGVHASRHLVLEGAVLKDSMSVTAEQSRQIDWVFHGAGAFGHDGASTPASLPENEDGYGYLSEMQKVEGLTEAKYVVDGKTLALSFEKMPKDAIVYVGLSPDSPADIMRHTILIRVKGVQSEVGVRYVIS